LAGWATSPFRPGISRPKRGETTGWHPAAREPLFDPRKPTKALNQQDENMSRWQTHYHL